MAQNSTKMALYGPKWPFITLNDASMKSLHDPKCPCMTPNGHETFLRGIIHDYMPYWTTLWPFQRHTWPPWASEKAPGWSSMTQYHVIYPWEVFQGHLGSYMDILGHEGPFLVMKGHFWCCFGPLWGPRGPLKRAQGRVAKSVQISTSPFLALKNQHKKCVNNPISNSRQNSVISYLSLSKITYCVLCLAQSFCAICVNYISPNCAGLHKLCHCKAQKIAQLHKLCMLIFQKIAVAQAQPKHQHSL